MNTIKFLRMKERADIFQPEQNIIPFNIYTQNIYSGINAFNLTTESRLLKKTAAFLTPLQVSKLGGNIIPPVEFYFKKGEVNKYLPEANETNIDSFRKELFFLYKNEKIKAESSEFSTDNCFKINGGNYFDVFIKESLKKPIYIENRYGFTSIQIENLYNMNFEEIKKFLDDNSAIYHTKLDTLDKNYVITLDNISTVNTYKVVSIDDVYGIKLDSFVKNYIQQSGILSKTNNDLDNIINSLIKTISEIYNLKEINFPVYKSSIQKIHGFLRVLCESEISKNLYTEPALLLNKKLHVELTANRIFNSLGLFGLDKSGPLFADLLNKTTSSSIFKQNHIILQSYSYSTAKNILSNFDFKEFKKNIDQIGNLTNIKNKLISQIQAISDTNFYEKCNFSSKGNLTVYDFNKVNFIMNKIGISSSFDKNILDLFKNYGFECQDVNFDTLRGFIKKLTDQEKKGVKNDLQNNFYEFKGIDLRNVYLNSDINYEKFEKSDFYSFIAKNEIKNILELLYNKIDNNFIKKIEENITDENKITFKKNINLILDELYIFIKKDIHPKDLENLTEKKEEKRR